MQLQFRHKKYFNYFAMIFPRATIDFHLTYGNLNAGKEGN